MKVKKLVQESRVHIGNWNMETLTGKRMGSVLSISYDTQYVSYQLERDMYHILYCTHLYRSIRSRIVQFWLVLRFVLLHCASFSLLEDVTLTSPEALSVWCGTQYTSLYWDKAVSFTLHHWFLHFFVYSCSCTIDMIKYLDFFQVFPPLWY